MNIVNSDLNLKPFFPENLKIQKIINTENTVYIYLKSTVKQSVCPHCGQISKKYHATHSRTVQDLPIFGKTTYLKMELYDFECCNPNCSCISHAETFEGFFLHKGRMTERLIDLVVELAVNTSCEGAAKILQTMNIKISGDTVIRSLIRRYSKMVEPKSGNCIGVDDFALKKGQIYGTVIVDEKTHTPLAILEGRDGKALEEWLEQNKHVTAITRDRASAYAKAIEKILPDAMQIADRFHLYQNLMDAVKKIIKAEIRAESKTEETGSKKNAINCG